VLADRYRLIARLGRGGFGEVWRAEDSRLGREVAVKTLTLPVTDEAQKRFAREGRALARLDHPNVVAVYDCGVDDGTGYLVMQLLSGPSLATLCAESGPLPVDTAIDLAEQAAAGLAGAHRAGIVHRDVSPANLILDAEGTLKVVDFGVARLHEASAELTVTGTVFATPGYVSPEQAEGRPAEPRSDLYSLGCVLYALLTGEPPFTGEHPMGVIKQHLMSPPPPLASRRGGVPASVEGIVADLLAKDPRDRPRSADDLVDRLAAIRAHPGAGGDGSAATRRPTAIRGRGRVPWMLLAVALAVVALGALLLTRLDGGGSSTPGHANTTAHSGRASTTTRGQTGATTPTTGSGSPARALRTPAQAIAAARAAVAQARRSGRLDAAAADDVDRHLEDIGRALQQPDPKDVAHKVDDLIHHLDDLVKAGQLTATGRTQISAPLNRAAALLPAAKKPPGNGKGENGQGGRDNGPRGDGDG
jgi:hypothetical protein